MFKLPFATAIIESFSQGYSTKLLRHDILAGVTVGIVAVPLAMALAIASGVPPQYGLYTSIIAGIVIALTGGSRVNISGPTAAFVVILLPVTEQFGLGGLLIATVMAGIILVLLGLARMGQLIQFIPYPVTTGFTTGIAVVIALLQIKDFLGLELSETGAHFLEKLWLIAQSLPQAHQPDVIIGIFTLASIMIWRRITTSVPAYLVALVVGSLIALFVNGFYPEQHAATIGSRFQYTLEGITSQGIPPVLPHFVWPWALPDASGQAVGISYDLVRALIGPAFAIAMLGAIESLLCAVVADGMAGTKHNPNAELIGQGLGNIVTPFFGGITATAAIARTAASVRAGGSTPVAAIVHGLVVLLAVVSLAPLLAYVPMASLAAILLMVAWNMSEAKHFVHILKVAPKSDVLVLLTCFSLTVIFDMVIAVGVGVALAALLFIRRMSDLTGTRIATRLSHAHPDELPKHVVMYDINGPLFFGAAEKAISVMQRINKDVKVVILDMGDVPMMDMTGTVALETIISKLTRKNIAVIIANLSPQLVTYLKKAGIKEDGHNLRFCPDASCVYKLALEMLPDELPQLHKV